MPACQPRCPVVRAQLRKIVAEAPWIVEKGVAADAPGVKLRTVTRRPEYFEKNEADENERTHARAYREIAEVQFHSDVPDSDADEASRRTDGRGYAIQRDEASQGELPYTVAQDPTIPKDAETYSRFRDTASDAVEKGGTIVDREQQNYNEIEYASEGTDYDAPKLSVTEMSAQISQRSVRSKIVETDVRPEIWGVKGASEFDEKETETEMGAAIDTATETLIQGTEEDTEMKRSGTRYRGVDLWKHGRPRDECEPTCPRRVSRHRRIQKLEERQRAVDIYLLTKGTNYFDDVCTCSLSCVIRALRDDPFIRSILTSAALFSLGLKLCEELNAWHLPSRVS